MKGKFIIFAVCAIVVQGSLPMVSSSAPRDQDMGMLDLSLVKAHHAVAILQSEKIAQTTYDIERRGCLAKSCLQNNYSAEESSYAERACQEELFPLYQAASDTILAAALIVDPGATSNVETARTIVNGTETTLVEGICSAIVLPLGRNSSGVRVQIQAIADSQASGSRTYDEAMFSAFVNYRGLHPKSAAAIQRIENKAIWELGNALNITYNGILALVSCGTENETDALSAIAIARDQNFAGIKADVDAKFGVILSLIMASYIVEFGVPANFSSIGAINTAAGYGYQNSASSNSATCKTDTPDVVFSNENAVGECDVQSARQTVTFQMQKVTAGIFYILRRELAKVHLRQQIVAENDFCKFEDAREDTYAADSAAVDAAMDSILIVNSGATSSVEVYRNAAKSKVKVIFDVIFDTISLVCGENSSKNLTEIQVMEDSAIRTALSIIEIIYDAIQKNLKNNAEFRTTMKFAKDNSISEMKKSVHSIFNGIKIRLNVDSSQDQNQSEHSIILLFKIAYTEASFAIKTSVQSIFDIIESSCKTLGGSQAEILANLTAIQFHREISMQQVVRAVDIVFTVIKIDMAKVPLIDHNVPGDSADDVEACRAEPSGASGIISESLSCVIPTTDPAASSRTAALAFSMLYKAVELAYEAIRAALDMDYSTIQATETKSARYFSEFVSITYTAIRKARKCDARTEAMIDRLEQETNNNTLQACHAIFNGSRILAAAISSRNQSENEDSLYLITAAYNEAACQLYEYSQNLFDAIDLILSTCIGDGSEIPEASCPATIY